MQCRLRPESIGCQTFADTPLRTRYVAIQSAGALYWIGFAVVSCPTSIQSDCWCDLALSNDCRRTLEGRGSGRSALRRRLRSITVCRSFLLDPSFKASSPPPASRRHYRSAFGRAENASSSASIQDCNDRLSVGLDRSVVTTCVGRNDI